MTSILNGAPSADYTLVQPRPVLGFRMQRSQATAAGYVTPLADPVKAEVEALQQVLSETIWPADRAEALALMRQLVKLPIAPRRPGRGIKKDAWAEGSLQYAVINAQENVGEVALGEAMDTDTALVDFRYAVDSHLEKVWAQLDAVEQALLGSRGIRDLLIVRAHLMKGITSEKAALVFMREAATALKEVRRAVLIGAVRAHVHDHAISLPALANDTGAAVDAFVEGVTSLTEPGFEAQVEAIIDQLLDQGDYDKIIAKAKLVGFPAAYKPKLIQLIKASPITITELNAPWAVPPLASQVLAAAAPASGPKSGPLADPYEVDLFVEDTAQLQVNTAAVRCAAQLYYVMALGDELGVFQTVRYFTHHYLFRDGFAVEDPVLRRDLENYVFSEQFPGKDRDTGEIRMMRCTQDAERRSFYRQVFDQTDEAVPGDGVPNSDFRRLWKILMLESTRHIERAQASYHAETWVSRQNVMQAAEDLQYNLSSSCVGMATVVTPLMHAELDFVVRRILGHPEVRRHLVPTGGSWLKVVEKLQSAQGRPMRASILTNKAKQGYSLLRAIADYTPSRFEQDSVFFPFISDVEAFITTQSILQEEGEELTDDGGTVGSGYGMPTFPGMPAIPGLPNVPGMPGASGAPAGDPYSAAPAAPASPGGEWDF